MRRSDGYLYTPGDDRSGVLLRALNQYIAENKVPYTAASMSLEDHFMEVEINSADEDDEDDPEKHTEIGYLKTYYRIRQKPPEEKWIEIEKDLEFHLAVENEKRPVDKDTAPQLRVVSLWFVRRPVTEFFALEASSKASWKYATSLSTVDASLLNQRL